MRLSVLIGIITMFIVLSLLSGIMEMQFLSGDGSQAAVITQLLEGNLLEKAGAIGDLITFNYAFFVNGWEILRYVLFLPFGVATITMVISAIRGVSSN